jgi:hypothetical protein
MFQPQPLFSVVSASLLQFAWITQTFIWATCEAGVLRVDNDRTCREWRNRGSIVRVGIEVLGLLTAISSLFWLVTSAILYHRMRMMRKQLVVAPVPVHTLEFDQEWKEIDPK